MTSNNLKQISLFFNQMHKLYKPDEIALKKKKYVIASLQPTVTIKKLTIYYPYQGKE